MERLTMLFSFERENKVLNIFFVHISDEQAILKVGQPTSWNTVYVDGF
jgi:hypothetical protein